MKYKTELLIIIFALFMLFGTLTGDQLTLRDCSTFGNVKLLGGGEIKCEVIRK